MARRARKTAILFGLMLQCHTPITEKSVELDIDGLQQRLENAQDTGSRLDSPLAVIGALWSHPQARTQSITIHRTAHQESPIYDLQVTFDEIPSDDSIAGYRYYLRIQHAEHVTWRVLSGRTSWRCWEDRGHPEYLATPCT